MSLFSLKWLELCICNLSGLSGLSASFGGLLPLFIIDSKCCPASYRSSKLSLLPSNKLLEAGDLSASLLSSLRMLDEDSSRSIGKSAFADSTDFFRFCLLSGGFPRVEYVAVSQVRWGTWWIRTSLLVNEFFLPLICCLGGRYIGWATLSVLADERFVEFLPRYYSRSRGGELSPSALELLFIERPDILGMSLITLISARLISLMVTRWDRTGAYTLSLSLREALLDCGRAFNVRGLLCRLSVFSFFAFMTGSRSLVPASDSGFMTKEPCVLLGLASLSLLSIKGGLITITPKRFFLTFLSVPTYRGAMNFAVSAMGSPKLILSALVSLFTCGLVANCSNLSFLWMLPLSDWGPVSGIDHVFEFVIVLKPFFFFLDFVNVGFTALFFVGWVTL